MHRHFFPASLLLCFGLLAAPVYADTTLTFVEVTEEGETEVTQTMKMTEEKLRFEGGGSQGASLIYDAAANRVVVLRQKDQQYLEMDPEKVAGMVEKVNDIKDQAMVLMEERLKNVPPDQQEKIRKMMGKLQGVTSQLDEPEKIETTFTETGRKEKIGEYETTVIEAYEGDRKTGEYYVVDRSALKISDGEMATMTKFQGFLRQLMEALPGGSDKRAFDFDVLAVAEGKFPVAVKKFEADGSVTMQQLEKVSNEALGAEPFAIPEGYTEAKLPF